MRVFGVGAAVGLAAIGAGTVPAVGRVQGAGQGSGDGVIGSVRIDPESVPRPSLRALRTSSPIEIDGRLDEPVWQLADSATHFLQALPRDGYPPTEETIVHVVYDDHNLYIGAMLYDSEPDRLYVPSLEQDFATHNSDLFGVTLDTYLDRKNAYAFATNPHGAIWDAQNFNDSRYTNLAWEGVVRLRTRIVEEGWTVEMAIPLTTLRFDASDGEQSWGLNFLRRVRRKGEDSYWAPLPRQHRIHKMSQAGTLTGLVGLHQGRNLTVKPYLKGERQVGDLRLSDDAGNDMDGGVDIKYGVTSELTLDVTALTDFSQVEVDQEQVNLTRFSLFFPEKRDFFLENDGVFSFGDVAIRNFRTGSSPRNFKLFHSRRIGLSDDRRPIPIAAGARLTGRAGAFELGLLEIQTRNNVAAPAENFAVARVRRSILGHSDIGAVFINRQATSGADADRYNRSAGVDANFNVLRNLFVNTYLARTDEPGAVGNRNAGWLQLAWRDPIWDVSGFVKHVGDAFDPGVGFVNRRGIRQAFATIGAHPQPAVHNLQELNPHMDVSFISDLSGNLETRLLTAGLGLTFVDGGRFSVEATSDFERLTADTPIVGINVPAGDYDFSDLAVSYTTSGARWISGNVRVRRGGFYDGDRTSISGTAVITPNYHLQVDLSAEYNDLELAGERTTADVFGGRVRYAYSTSLFTSAFVQYNTLSDELVANVRLNLIHAPLSDVFLVYTERRAVEAGSVLDRVLTAKVTKLIAF